MKVTTVFKVRTQGNEFFRQAVLNRNPSQYSFPALERRSELEPGTQGWTGWGCLCLPLPSPEHWGFAALLYLWMLSQGKLWVVDLTSAITLQVCVWAATSIPATSSGAATAFPTAQAVPQP